MEPKLAAWLAKRCKLYAKLYASIEGLHRRDLHLLPVGTLRNIEIDQHATTTHAGSESLADRGRQSPGRAGPGSETHEDWIELMQHLNIEPLKERKN
jgi:hypothetical protein